MPTAHTAHAGITLRCLQATAAYESFLVGNAQRVASQLGMDVESGEGHSKGGGVRAGGSSGVCLDRGDWIYLVNLAADDGRSALIDGRPARSLLTSWRQVVPKIAEALHSPLQSDDLRRTGKPLALFVNPDKGHRLDMYRRVDGIFDEMGDPMPGGMRTASGWLTAGGKVGVIWCHDPKAGYGNATKCAEFMTNGTDDLRHRFLQSHLLYGLFPTVPVKDNDHQIQPSTRADTFYSRYGPLWQALRAKRWLTAAHAISVVEAPPPIKGGASRMRVNAFEHQPYGSGRYAVAVAFGAAGNATVRLRLPELQRYGRDDVTFTAVATLLDGLRMHCSCTESPGSGAVDVTVPLQAEGCAVVTLNATVRRDMNRPVTGDSDSLHHV